METRPASLDGMSGHHGLDEFRVSSPRDVGTLLKQLLDGSVLLNLNGSDGRVFTSAIWTLDSTRGTIGFNADPNDPALQSMLHSREVVVVGYLESVKVQFDVQNLVLVHGNRASVLSCPFPREMFRFQRRNAFRVRPLMRSRAGRAPAPSRHARHRVRPARDRHQHRRLRPLPARRRADDERRRRHRRRPHGARRRHPARRRPAPAPRDLARTAKRAACASASSSCGRAATPCAPCSASST